MPISIYGETNPSLAAFMPDRNATIWRYMDIGKYLDLITRRELWFTRVSELRGMDPYEGELTPFDIERMKAVLAARNREELRATFVSQNRTGIVMMMDAAPERSHYYFQLVALTTGVYVMGFRPYTHSVSCWHENVTESDAMWGLYAKREAGIAINSTIDRSLHAFQSCSRTLFIAKVHYDSQNKLSALTSGMFDAILIKRHAFHHENEIRIIAVTMDGYEAPEWSPENQKYLIDPTRPVPSGYYVPCDLGCLIEEVIISPLMSSHYAAAVESITKHLLPTMPIRKSTLLSKEEAGLQLSPELALMLGEYQRTKFLVDIDQIRSRTEGTE